MSRALGSGGLVLEGSSRRRLVRPVLIAVLMCVLAFAVVAAAVLSWRGLPGMPGVVEPAPSGSSGVIEPATVDPLPVVGETPTPGGSAIASAQPQAAAEALAAARIQVPLGQPDPSAPTLVPTPGLPDTATTAMGYRFDDAGLNRAALATVLARKFGVEGQPARAKDGSWTVTPPGRWLPRITVDPGPMVTWSYAGLPTLAERAVSASPPASPPVASPSAEEVTRSFLGDLGVPIDDLDWQVVAVDGTTVVTGWQVVAGQRTSAGWRMAYGPDGQIRQASGFAATPIELPQLPVAGVVTALARAQQPRWSALGPTLVAAAPSATASPMSSPMLSPAQAPGTVLEADLVLAQFTQPDGRLLVLPAYLLRAADGSTWSLVAVADQALSLPTPP